MQQILTGSTGKGGLGLSQHQATQFATQSRQQWSQSAAGQTWHKNLTNRYKTQPLPTSAKQFQTEVEESYRPYQAERRAVARQAYASTVDLSEDAVAEPEVDLAAQAFDLALQEHVASLFMDLARSGAIESEKDMRSTMEDIRGLSRVYQPTAF